MDLKETGCKAAEWIQLAKQPSGSMKVGDFLTTWMMITFPERFWN
jgi:hypothetical protein